MPTSPRSSNSNDNGSWSRRRSLFALSALQPENNAASNDQQDGSRPYEAKKLTKHNRTSSQFSYTSTGQPDSPLELQDNSAISPATTLPKDRRRSLTMKGSLKRPPSVFGSLKASLRTSYDQVLDDGGGDPVSTTSSKAPSIGFPESSLEGVTPGKTVILHGEVQTSAGMFRKKKEYLVLTETHIMRFKSQAKAAESFKAIAHLIGRSPMTRHSQMPSIGSQSDLQTLSDTSGDKDGRVPLRQVVAVHRLDDGRPYFALEICYLDEDSGQASSLTLQFSNPDERDAWLKHVRRALVDLKGAQSSYISPFNLEQAARVVEREHDYDPANCAIFKVVRKQSGAKSGRSSSEDVSKVVSTVCFLAIGVHKVHIIQLVKPAARSSSPSLGINTTQSAHGILTLTALRVSGVDDTFELTFRRPLERPRTLYLASSASHEIAARLHFVENHLRPECGHRLFRFAAPQEVEILLSPPIPSDEDNSSLDRTLIAYCVAYSANPARIRYTINYDCEDAPRFELLPRSDSRGSDYTPLELLAIMRALRYNESFGSISFAMIRLDGLNGVHDNHGQEYVCSRTKRGTPIKLSAEELGRSSLLVQEIRALAATSKKLRRMDFSGCITATPPQPAKVMDEEPVMAKDIGCGIVEALFPLCKHQTTNVDWICLNGIVLSDTDLDYLVGAAVDKSCHLRAIELKRCGLSDRSLGLILDALRAQDNTLEAVEIAGNTARLNPVAFDSQLSIFGFIRKLDLSQISRTSGNEPLLQIETLLIWRLQELRLSGTTLNRATIDAISTYLAHPQSQSLHELYLDNCYLSGSDVATLLHSMSHDPKRGRDLHLDISQSYLSKGLDQVAKAIAGGLAPTRLSMRAIEYREEHMFRKMVGALTVNKTIQYLDISQTALPSDASDDACHALETLLAENDVLLELDISGEDSRLATSKLGSGINQALLGLKQNRTLQCCRVQKQKLGLQGASTLAEVLKENRTLRELHCDDNEIPLHGLTDLVNSLVDNTTLIYLPSMADGRAAAFKSAEMTMKGMSDMDAPASPRSPTFSPSAPFGGTSAMKRGLASVRKTASRSASAYAPSFPNLPSYGRSMTTPDSRSFSSPLSMSLPPQRTRQNSQSPVAASMAFTVQDIQTTHRLLTEQWDRQCYRLAQYLDRNWCLLNNIPVDLEIEDEKFERPESVGSLVKALQQVQYDTTPKAEKEMYFGPPVEALPETGGANHGRVDSRHENQAISLKQFMLEGAVPKSSEVDGHERTKGLGIDTKSERLDEPTTPTQPVFPRSRV